MEKIIYLEVDEEITSVIDRVKSCKSRSVALIIPRGASVVSGVVNLKLLRREADKLKKNIALVTTDKTAKKLASQVGFSVFNNLDEVVEGMPGMEAEEEEASEMVPEKLQESSDLKMPEIKFKKMSEARGEEPAPSASRDSFSARGSRKSFWQILTTPINFNWRYALGALVILLCAGAFTAFFLLPKATITLTLNSEDFDHQFRVKVDKSIQEYNPEENAIPGEVVTTTKLVSQKAQATGKKEIGEKAKGTITVYNEWTDEAQSFAAGTKFRGSSGRVYVASAGFSLPGVSFKEGKVIAGRATVKAEAVSIGAEYNGQVGGVTIPSLPSAQQVKIYGQASNFEGGYKKTITVVSEDDVKKIKDSAVTEATKVLKEEIKKEISAGSQIAEEALAKDIIEEEISPKVGEETKDFEVKVQVKVSTLSYREEDLDKITQDNIEKVLDGRVLVTSAEKKIAKKLVKQDLSTGVMTIDISVVAQVGPEVDEKKLKENILRKNEAEIDGYLDDFEEVEEVEIALWPFWVKKVPGLADSVRIELKYIAQEEEVDQPQSDDVE